MHIEMQYAAKMATEVALYTQLVQRESPNVVISENALQALANVPRHIFAPQLSLESAYANCPQPIGFGQTISQPFIVALMTSLLDVKPGQKVLEIGTGSGYQAAVLAQLNVEVYTVELIADLATIAAEKFNQLKIKNIHTLNANGSQGWREFAPYDGIIVTAASRVVPQPLVEQLKNGGRMVIPLENSKNYQELVVVTKQSAEQLHHKSILPVHFVPFQML